MGDTYILSFCEHETNKDLCNYIAKLLGVDSLYDVVPDDWRRPVIDGILYAVFWYNVGENDRKEILEILRRVHSDEFALAVATILLEGEIRDKVSDICKSAKNMMETAIGRTIDEKMCVETLMEKIKKTLLEDMACIYCV